MTNKVWQELVASAVLGTQRQAAKLPDAEGLLGIVLARLDQANTERMLLGAAGLLGAFQRAAWLPAIQPAYTIPPAEAEDRPVCSAQAAQHLQAMLGGSQRELLGEWFAVLNQIGLRIPAMHLPEVLEIGRTTAQLRPAIVQAVGVRGAWLAHQHAAWNYAEPQYAGLPIEWEALQQLWETSPHNQRMQLLSTLRGKHPEPARAFVELTWTSEKAEHRAAFLAVLEQNLSMADEPFLEAVLDDRGKEVRATAIDLLARLPKSRLVQRMIARTETLMRWEPPERARLLGLQRGKPGTITLMLPETCDKAMIRDGVNPKAVMQQQKMGERAQWMLQMLRTIPPTYWSTRFQTNPTDLLAAASRSEWRMILEAAWVYAAQNTQDAAWSETLLRSDSSFTTLLTILPIERQEALILDVLANNSAPLATNPVIGLLLATTHIWSTTLTRSVLDALRANLSRRRQTSDYRLYGALDHFARSMPPKLAKSICDTWPATITADEHWQGVLDRMLVTLQFRAEMREALGVEG